jgi:5-methylcytosine rRNA methyltransferase NSUN4
MARKTKPTFDEWYHDLFGDRWPGLKASLVEEQEHTELTDGLLKPYFLDEASVMAAGSLGVEPGHRVLDMCAAPGGKSLVLALRLDGCGSLTANDRSSARRARLHRVLDEYLPTRLRDTVDIRSHDATRWGLYEKDVYDRVLLDAPCSSERHVINSPSHLAKWTPARTRNLAAQAYSLLASAFLATKPGGHIVYSTCALSPLENDEVVGKLLRKKAVVSIPLDQSGGETTAHGVQFFPDRDGGRGPMYVAKLQKADID